MNARQMCRRVLLRQVGAGVGWAAAGTALAGAALAGIAPATASAATAVEQDGDPLQELKDGNARFVSGSMSHPRQDPERRQQVASGQDPFAVIFSCIDSRVPPEIVFDQGLGDLFVIRTGGQDYDSLIEGSIEYGPVTDATPLIVVMGHQRCGAVTAAVNALSSGTYPPPHINQVVRAIEPAYRAATRTHPQNLVDATIRAQTSLTVWALQSDLSLRRAVNQQQLMIVGAYYSLDTGVVSWSQ
jgi:carbonic anhydrase